MYYTWYSYILPKKIEEKNNLNYLIFNYIYNSSLPLQEFILFIVII